MLVKAILNRNTQTFTVLDYQHNLTSETYGCHHFLPYGLLDSVKPPSTKILEMQYWLVHKHHDLETDAEKEK